MKTILIIIPSFAFILGCSQNTAKHIILNQNQVDSSKIKKHITSNKLVRYDYLNDDGTRIDSTKIYYKEGKQLESIFYNSNHIKNSILSKGFYNNGIIKSVSYYKKIPQKNDTIYIGYYPNGKISFLQTIVKDSCDLPKQYISYYENGNIQERGVQDIYSSSIISIGIWEYFDSSGNLKKTTYFHPDEFGKDYKIVTEYTKSGKIVSKKIYTNDELYETEEKELKEIPK